MGSGVGQCERETPVAIAMKNVENSIEALAGTTSNLQSRLSAAMLPTPQAAEEAGSKAAARDDCSPLVTRLLDLAERLQVLDRKILEMIKAVEL